MSQNPDSMMLENLSEKLDYNSTALKNAETYLRILKTKSNVKNISETAKAVLCLDLAATVGGTNINREVAIKLSGLKKSVYLNNLHTTEKILDLDRPLVISELCVQLSCMPAKDMAEQILKKYQERDEIGRDFSHPQYAAAAICIACKLKQVKIQKSQLVMISRLKQVQWKELEQEFWKFAEESGFNTDNKKKAKGNNDFLKYLEENSKDNQNTISQKNQQEDDEEEEKIEEYEVWKKRILTEAYEALKKSNDRVSEKC